MTEQTKKLFLILLTVIVIVSSCGKTEDEVKQEYLAKGGNITNLAQGELLKNVSMAMQKGGPEYAIEFCNIRALPLLDSLSSVNNCKIRRIAIKYRNIEDKPQSEIEEAQLNQYVNALSMGSPLEPQVLFFDDRVEYYKPIMLGMDACLKCHGEPGTQITEATLQKINELYPDDLATGFVMGDFRGAWKITFMK